MAVVAVIVIIIQVRYLLSWCPVRLSRPCNSFGCGTAGQILPLEYMAGCEDRNAFSHTIFCVTQHFYSRFCIHTSFRSDFVLVISWSSLIWNEVSHNFIPGVPTDNNSVLVQAMAGMKRTNTKPLTKPIMTDFTPILSPGRRNKFCCKVCHILIFFARMRMLIRLHRPHIWNAHL